MTGSRSLDLLAAVTFGVVAVVTVARLVIGRRQAGLQAETALHAVMAVGMVAMSASVPGLRLVPDAAWIAIFLAGAVGSVVALARRATSPGNAALHALGCLIMVVGFGVGHAGGHDADTAGSEHHATSAMSEGEHDMSGMSADEMAAMHGNDRAAGGAGRADHAGPEADGLLTAAAGWPVWPAVAVAFAFHALWLATRRSEQAACACPLPEDEAAAPSKDGLAQRARSLVAGSVAGQACAVTMATGMALMAYTL